MSSPWEFCYNKIMQIIITDWEMLAFLITHLGVYSYALHRKRKDRRK